MSSYAGSAAECGNKSTDSLIIVFSYNKDNKLVCKFVLVTKIKNGSTDQSVESRKTKSAEQLFVKLFI